MEVTIPVSSAKEILTGFTKVVRQKSVVPYVWIQPGKKGVKVTSTNFGEHLCYSCPEAKADGKEGFPLKIADLRVILSDVRGDTLSIKVKDKDLDVKFYEDLWTVTVTLDRMSSETSSPVPDEMFEKWKLVKFPDFRDLYMFALPYSSHDETRQVLNGVCFHEDGSVVATDGRRLVMKSHAHSLKLKPKTPIDIPGLSPFPRDASLIVKDSTWLRWKGAGDIDGIQVMTEENKTTILRVKVGNWQYAANCADGKYPNYQQVVPLRTPDSYFELKDDAIRAFRYVRGVVTHRDDCVRIDTRKTKLILNAENHQDNRKVKIDMEGCGGGDLKYVTGLSVTYFLQALASGFRKFHQEDSMSPSVSFHDGWTHVLMPMRVV